MLHRTTVLVLNRHWLAIDAVSPAEAFGHLARRTARALHVERDNIQPFDWEDWRELPLTEGSPSIGTPHGRVRIPTVIVLNRYAKVRLIVPTFGFRGLWERDRGRCQYTGRMLRPAEANIDHVVPRSRGGTDCWENCVLDRKVNSRKGCSLRRKPDSNCSRHPAFHARFLRPSGSGTPGTWRTGSTSYDNSENDRGRERFSRIPARTFIPILQMKLITTEGLDRRWV